MNAPLTYLYLCAQYTDYLSRPAAQRGEPQHRCCVNDEKVFVLSGSVCVLLVVISWFIIISLCCRDGSVHISCVEQNNGKSEVITIPAAS